MKDPAPVNLPICDKGPSISAQAWVTWLNFLDRLPVYATAALPAGGPNMDGKLIIENTGSAANIIMYTGGKRYRISGGTAF